MRRSGFLIGCFWTLLIVALLVLGLVRWLAVYAPLHHEGVACGER